MSVLTIDISGGEFAVPRKFPVNGSRFKYFSCSFWKDVAVFGVTIS